MSGASRFLEGRHRAETQPAVAESRPANASALRQTSSPLALSVGCGVLASLLAVAAAPAWATDYYWDTNGATPGAGGPTPNGTWSTGGTTLSTDSTGATATAPVTTTTADRVVFSAGSDATGAYTVTVNGTQNIGGLVFKNGTATLTGGTINFGTAAATIDSGATSATISSVLNGTAGLTKAGTGALTLSGVNTFSGGVNVTAGILTVSGDAALGAASNGIVMASGTRLTASSGAPLAASRVVTLTSGSVTLSGGRVGAARFTGAGGIIALSGVSLSNNANDYTGQTQVAGAATNFSFSSIANLGVASSLGAPTTVANGTILVAPTSGAPILNYTGTGSSSNRNWTIQPVFPSGFALSNTGSGVLTLTGAIAVTNGAAGNIRFNATGADMALLGVISNGTPNQPLFFGGSSGRTITLGGANTYSGTTSITVATVQAGVLANFGVASSLGTGSGSVGTVSINSNGVLSYTGAGASTNRGYQLNNGALRNNGSGALALTGTMAITNTATLGGSFSGANTISGVISGTGALTVNGAGTWALTNTNTYTGGTAINAGVLQVSSDANLGAAAGGLSFGGGTLQTTAALTTNRATTLNAGGGTVDTNGFDVTMGGLVSGAGALTKVGAGTLTLTAANTYAGPTTISAGTLQIGNGGTTGTLPGDVANAGALMFNRSDTLTMGGVVSGAGSVTQFGTGTTVLTANNTYTGGTTITAGVLQLGNGSTAGSIVGDVTDNGALVFNRSDSVTFGGVVSGTGGVSQIGAGMTTLTGANTYTGGTTISAGTLTGSATSFGAGAILNNAALVINQPADASFANAINGGGSFTKQGAGRLNYTGTGALTGPTTVAAGTLSVNGSLATSAVTVNSGATLGGNGTVGATTIQPGGVVAPGNSIGTLHVNGNVSFAAGSIYQVEVDPAGTASDLIHATGTATLNGGSVIHVGLNGTYQPVQRYTILTADQGVTGTFSSVSSVFTFLDPTLSYDANDVYLTLLRNSTTFPSVGVTANQRATAAALDSLPESNPLLSAITLLDASNARAAFDQLSGEIHPSLAGQMIEDGRFIRDAAVDRLTDAFCGIGYGATIDQPDASGVHAGACVANPDRFTVWGHAFGAWGHQGSDGNAASLSRSIGGFFAGLDAPVYDDWRAGVLAGYSHSNFNVENRGSSAESDDYTVGLYGGRTWGPLALKLGAAYTWHDIDTNRAIGLPGFSAYPSAGYHADTAQAFGELDYRLQLAGVDLTPFVNLADVNQHVDGFTEQGGPEALLANGANENVVFSTLGIHSAMNFNLVGLPVVAKATLGWRHAYGEVTPSTVFNFAGSAAFTIHGLPIARDAALVDAGLDIQVAKNATVGLSYEGQFGRKAIDQSVRGALTLRF